MKSVRVLGMTDGKYLWRIVYRIYPPFLRILEKLRIHSGRQPYFLGYLKPGKSSETLRSYLITHGYEHVYLAWRDAGEVLSMRKVDREIFQYHIRLFQDGELRGHYEYSSEGSPLGHILKWCFEEREGYFKELLEEYMN